MRRTIWFPGPIRPWVYLLSLMAEAVSFFAFTKPSYAVPAAVLMVPALGPSFRLSGVYALKRSGARTSDFRAFCWLVVGGGVPQASRAPGGRGRHAAS